MVAIRHTEEIGRSFAPEAPALIRTRTAGRAWLVNASCREACGDDPRRGATMEGMRKFNIAGPVVAADHYCIPPLERVNLQALLELVQDKTYFVLHAPRQTGKTSALRALRDLLNSGAAGEYRCVYADFEIGQPAREDTARAMRPCSASWPARRT